MLTRAHKQKKYFWYLGVLAAVALVLLVSNFFFSGIRSAVSPIFTPFWKAGLWMQSRVNSVGAVFVSKKSLLTENETLKQKLSEVESEILASRIIAVENADLKNTFHRKNPERNFILATILVKPNHTAYDTLIVDQGSAENISANMHVYAGGVYPIGEIKEVFTHTALVALYSTPGTTKTVRLGLSHTDIDVTGRGGGSFEAKLPRDLALAAGDPVVLPELDQPIIALVDTVVSDERDPFKKVLFRSPVNIQELSSVYIAK